jgi:hypothetical protein
VSGSGLSQPDQCLLTHQSATALINIYHAWKLSRATDEELREAHELIAKDAIEKLEKEYKVKVVRV